LESAIKIADRITVLDRGRVLAVDSAEGLRGNPNRRIQNLLNRRPENPEVDPAEYLRRLAGEA
jgi:phospholipid/cholesterol/gamma-HCH transport system ATP-binding protein